MKLSINQGVAILKDSNGHLTIQEMAKKYSISEIENRVGPKILVIGEDLICYEIKRIIENTCGKNTVTTIDILDPEINNLKKPLPWDDYFSLQEVVDKFSWWKDYFIVLALTQNDPILAMRINQITCSLETTLLHGVIDGPFVFIGPTFSAKSGPCYPCFEKSITMSLQKYASYQCEKEISMLADLNHATSTKSPVIYVLSAHLAMEVINQRFFKTCFIRSKALSIYLPTMEVCLNEVLPLSDCSICGSVLHRDDQQVVAAL